MNADAFPKLGVAIGVLWAVWDVHGFWWALVYAIFWPTWLAYRAAQLLLGLS